MNAQLGDVIADGYLWLNTEVIASNSKNLPTNFVVFTDFMKPSSTYHHREALCVR